MTSYKPGNILLIPFPFTDFSTFKQRPCVIISSREFNNSHNDVIVAAITSNLEGQAENDTYKLNDAEQKAAGLPKPSLIKLGKIVTLDKRLIRKQLGQLPENSVNTVLERIRDIFQ